MTGSPGGTSTAPVALLEVDLTYGGVYAGASFEFSAAMAAHFNEAAARARDLLPGEFREFAAGEAFSIACPTRPAPRADFIAAYNQFQARIDESIDIHLGDHPHLFSAGLDDIETLRGTPTYVPKSIMPEGFFGRPHQVELFQGETRIFGPAERFFHTATSGAVYNQIEDAPGRLVLEVRGDLAVLARRGEVVFFTDPAFGEPTGVTQPGEDGSARALEWHLLGRDRVGDVMLFNEWVAVGVQPAGDRLVLEVQLPNRATGLAAALYSGHTRDTAFRPDASVL
jgi:hypothetical protein